MYTIKLTSANFISKGGHVFEVSPKILSECVHAGKIISNSNAQSEKHYKKQNAS